MVSLLSDKLAQKLVDYGVVSSDDLDTYQFGIQGLIVKTIHIITYLIIGLLFHQVFEVIIFTFAYVSLRKYAGGYHADTQVRCYLLSCLLILTAMSFIHLMVNCSFIVIVTIVLLLFSSPFIFLLSLVEDQNKPLDDVETQRYRNISRIILLIEIIIAILFLLLGLRRISFIVSLGLDMLAFMLVAGKAKNRFHVCVLK